MLGLNPKPGASPSASTFACGIFRFGLNAAYKLYSPSGITVFNPSLPPARLITTRIPAPGDTWAAWTILSAAALPLLASIEPAHNRGQSDLRSSETFGDLVT